MTIVTQTDRRRGPSPKIGPAPKSSWKSESFEIETGAASVEVVLEDGVPDHWAE